MPDNGHVACAVSFSNARQVFPEGNVEDPMERVLDSPMGAHGLCQGLCGHRPRGDVATPIVARTGSGFGFRLDQRDESELGALPVLATSTLMKSAAERATLAEQVLAFAGQLGV